MLHVSFNTPRQRKCVLFEITGRQSSSGSVAVRRSLNVPTHHYADVLFEVNGNRK